MSTAVSSYRFAEFELGNQHYYVVGYQPWHQGRLEIESFIARRFFEEYHASIDHFFPLLITLESASGQLCCALGVRSAQQTPLFLEQYFDHPLEQLISQRFNQPCHRDQVVEVGNLAAAEGQHSRYLFVALSDLLASWQARWLSCTGTRRVFTVFKRLGLTPCELGLADPLRLPDKGFQWGRYYQDRPMVMTGNIEDGHRRIVEAGFLEALNYRRYEVGNVISA